MRIVYAIVLLSGSLAAAQPPPSSSCNVEIVLAPAGVRAEIERWVAAEPRCTTSLQVRVVETEGQLYLFAKDGHGSTRERIVPDGQTAGALVASWIADDSLDAAWLGETTPRPRMPEVRTPGMYGLLASAAPPRRSRALAMTGGAYVGGDNYGPTGGVRVDLEVPLHRRSANGGAWLFAVGFAAGGSTLHGDGGEGVRVKIDAKEARATLGIAKLMSGQRWQLRVRAGALLRLMSRRVTEHVGPLIFPDPDEMDAKTASLWGAEASVQVARKLGTHWAFGGGPIVTKDVRNDGLPDVSYAPEITVFAGFTYTQ
ncbi:MAG: hypothetical protein ABI867_30370 [Kofleriaceae bacterium]